MTWTIDGRKVECSHCTNDKDLEVTVDNPAQVTVLCPVCAKETKYERRSTD